MANGTLLARLLADGTLDPSFGNGGVTTHSFGNPGNLGYFDDVALQADGKIVALGTALGTNGTYDNDFLVARYLGDPVLMTSSVACRPSSRPLKLQRKARRRPNPRPRTPTQPRDPTTLATELIRSRTKRSRPSIGS